MNQEVSNCGVVVTGLGVWSAAGVTPDSFWARVCAGESTARWLPGIGPGDGLPLAGCVAPAPVLTPAQRRATHKLDRCVHLAVAAAARAWDDAGLAAMSLDPQRCGVIVGTTRGPLGKIVESGEHLAAGRMLPTLATTSTISCLSGALANVFATHGPAFTVSAACASSAVAIAQGAIQILAGAADVMLVGGAEASLHPLVLAQLRAAGVLGAHPDPGLVCRPFDRDRNGTVLGEGAAFLILESSAHAAQRGARVQARLAGWAMGSAGGARAGIDESGASLERVMRQALDQAGLTPGQVGYLNAHGTGTRLNDRVEAKVIRRLAGGAVIPCGSTKAVTGHCLGAAAALEAVVCILALQHRLAPPSANCPVLDPECELDLVRGGARVCPGLRAAMSTSSGFWGHTAALVFAAPPEPPAAGRTRAGFPPAQPTV